MKITSTSLKSVLNLAVCSIVAGTAFLGISQLTTTTAVAAMHAECPPQVAICRLMHRLQNDLDAVEHPGMNPLLQMTPVAAARDIKTASDDVVANAYLYIPEAIQGDSAQVELFVGFFRTLSTQGEVLARALSLADSDATKADQVKAALVEIKRTRARAHSEFFPH